MPFLWDDIMYIAMNHFFSGSFVFWKMVPTRQEKRLRQWAHLNWLSPLLHI